MAHSNCQTTVSADASPKSIRVRNLTNSSNTFQISRQMNFKESADFFHSVKEYSSGQIHKPHGSHPDNSLEGEWLMPNSTMKKCGTEWFNPISNASVSISIQNISSRGSSTEHLPLKTRTASHRGPRCDLKISTENSFLISKVGSCHLSAPLTASLSQSNVSHCQSFSDTNSSEKDMKNSKTISTLSPYRGTLDLPHSKAQTWCLTTHDSFDSSTNYLSTDATGYGKNAISEVSIPKGKFKKYTHHHSSSAVERVESAETTLEHQSPRGNHRKETKRWLNTLHSLRDWRIDSRKRNKEETNEKKGEYLDPVYQTLKCAASGSHSCNFCTEQKKEHH